MEFFLSTGVKGEDIASIVCRNPYLSGSSLNETIIPCYDFLKRVLVHDELVIKSLKSMSWVGKEDLEKIYLTNFELLKKVGVPESNIQFIMLHYSNLLGLDNARFSERVNRVISMGFDPTKFLFLEAIRCLPTKSTWERKAQVCRSWGWSDSDISMAFKKNPIIMSTSVKKLTNVMDFFVNKMGWDPSDVAAAPRVFSYSLKKHTIPRWSTIRVLMIKVLIEKEELTLYSVTASTKKLFLDRFVFSYLEQIPQLLDIFEGKVDLSELGYGFDTQFSILETSV